MTLVIHRPWTKTFSGPFNNSTTSGVVNDNQEDIRSQKAMTKKATWRPPTPYSRFVREGYCDAVEFPCQWHYTDRWGLTQATYSGANDFGGGYSSNPPAPPQYLVDRTISRCYDKLKNDDVNLGQAFAERKQTDDLIGGNARRIAEDIEHGWTDRLKTLERDLRLARTPRRIKLLLKLLAKARLEIAYGWIPLMQDSFNAVKHLSEREKEANRAIITVTSRAKESYTDKATMGTDVGGVHFLIDRVREIEHEVFTRLDYYKDNGMLHELAQLGITNPASLAWEITPFSFVVDWFYPIGDYLNRLDATLGMSFRGGSTSKKTTVKVRPMNGRLEPGQSVEFWSATPNGKGRMVNFNRVVYGTSPQVPPPSFKTGGNLSHVYNGAALIAQALAKFF